MSGRSGFCAGWAFALALCAFSAFGGPPPEPPVPAQGPSEGRLPAGMPLEFVVGAYEIVGRFPDAENPYKGSAEIRLQADSLLMDRRIGGEAVLAKGALERTAEGVEVLRFRFAKGGIPHEATYLVAADLDNYARLSGYVYRREGGTRGPGSEALFSSHYRE